MEFKHYFIVKKNYKGEIAYINYDKMQGYSVTPKNRVPYEGVTVNKMILIKPSFIEKIIKKKIKRRLEEFLKWIINLLDSGDPDPSALKQALNELDRYRQIILNSYQQYLDERYIELLMKKINILENELKVRIILQPDSKMRDYYDNETKGKSR